MGEPMEAIDGNQPTDRPVDLALEDRIAPRARELFREQESAIFTRTNRLFSYLLLIEWVFGIGLALVLSPHTWIGARHQVHLHVWLAFLLGGALSIFPTYLCFTDPARATNRYILTGAQMMTCALWVHLTGGRVETHG